MDVDPAVDQLGRHLVRARAGVLVHEAAGVGHHAHVQRLGDRLRDLHAEPLREVPHHLRRARGVRVHVIQSPEPRVVVVVVDVEDAAARALERGRRRAGDVAAVQEHHDPLGQVGRRLGDEPLELDEPVLVRQRELVGGQERHRVLAERGQDVLHGGERADRVAVGPLVRGEQELVVVAQRRERLVAGGSGCRCRRSRVTSRPRARAAPSIRSARSTVSSYTKSSVGVCLRCSSSATRALQVAVRRPQAVERAPAHRSAAQDGHVYPRLAQVWGCIDCCHRDESDPWILQLRRDRAGQDLPHGLVHAPHPAAGHRSDSKSSHDATRRSTRTPCGNRASNIR